MKIEYGHIYICTEAERLGLGHRQCLVRVTGIERKPGGGIGRLEVYEIGSKQNARRYIYPEHLSEIGASGSTVSYESGLNYRTITVEKYDALLAVVEAAKAQHNKAAKAQHNKWDGYCAKYGRNCPTCIALDALKAAP